VKKKLTQTVYFKGDSAVLQTKAKQQLKALATKAVTYGYALKIQVTGRVKETADKSYDMRLSRQRAQNVANYLKTLKVKGKWVVTAAGISPENKAISRRVDISIVW
jgi:outer membrane protein OmpA-like peptidoglycan-associated protein